VAGARVRGAAELVPTCVINFADGAWDRARMSDGFQKYRKEHSREANYVLHWFARTFLTAKLVGSSSIGAEIAGVLSAPVSGETAFCEGAKGPCSISGLVLCVTLVSSVEAIDYPPRRVSAKGQRVNDPRILPRRQMG
jgi:hypothetical protein